MIGPHYERIAEVDNRLTAKELMYKFKSKVDNPLGRVLDKLKREFS